MTAEAAVAIAAGIIVSSIALVGFGLDSVIEFAAAAVISGSCAGSGGPRDQGGSAHRRHRFALAAYLAVPGICDLVTQARPGNLSPAWPSLPPPL